MRSNDGWEGELNLNIPIGMGVAYKMAVASAEIRPFFTYNQLKKPPDICMILAFDPLFFTQKDCERVMAKRTNTPSVSKRREQRQQEMDKKRQQQRIIGLVILAVVLAVIAWFVYQAIKPADTPAETSAAEAGSAVATGDRPLADLDPAERNGYYDAYPEMVIDTANSYQAVIEMADGGEMVIDLFDDEAPLSVNNFVFLANQGFYDGTSFHRVLADFMAQGGDPSGTGAGGPGYQFEDETDNGLVFDRPGLLAMANAGANTNGSQFFITTTTPDWLNGAHTIFGELVEGQEVLDGLTLRDPNLSPDFEGDQIERIIIIEQ